MIPVIVSGVEVMVAGPGPLLTVSCPVSVTWPRDPGVIIARLDPGPWAPVARVAHTLSPGRAAREHVSVSARLMLLSQNFLSLSLSLYRYMRVQPNAGGLVVSSVPSVSIRCRHKQSLDTVLQ